MGKHGQYGALVAALLAAPAVSGATGAECRLALALGFDVSRSVSGVDYRIQTGGVVAALNDAGIRDAFLKPDGRVALAIFEWSGPQHQEMVLDWRMIGSAADLDAAVAAVGAHRRNPVAEPTSLGEALDFARGLIADAPDCAARTLDVSGDGRNNAGPTPDRVYAREDFGDLTVNGLAIAGHESDIADYYARQVIRGRGAFVEPVARHEDFPPAFRRKLMRELSAPVLGWLPDGAGRLE